MVFSSCYAPIIEKSSRDHLTWHTIPLWEQVVKTSTKRCRVSNQNFHMDPTYWQHPHGSVHGYTFTQLTSLREQTKLHPAWANAREKFQCCSIRAKLWLNICYRGLKCTAQGLLGADSLLCFMLLLHPVDKDHMLSIKQCSFFFFFSVLGAKSRTPTQETTQGFRQNFVSLSNRAI